MGPAAKDIDAYIARYPRDVQAVLTKMRTTIRKAAPGAAEGISYGMPVFKLGGNLVYFGGFKHHVSFFPTRSPIRAFKKELAGYATASGTVRFELDEPIPYALIGRITKFRVKEERELAKLKASKRKK
jgi:uncharacterized protein YdhG (YjbR/CyaY superfamily)